MPPPPFCYSQTRSATESGDAVPGFPGPPSGGEESKRDSSTAQADAFAGANAEEKTPACSARNDRSNQGAGGREACLYGALGTDQPYEGPLVYRLQSQR